MTRRDNWATVSRCVVCGAKLVFLRSLNVNAKHDEGSKSCVKNHAKFTVYGSYNEYGEWSFEFVLPALSPRVVRRGR